MNQNKTFTRRSALRTLAGLPLAAMIGAPRLAGAAAPEYVFKYGNNLPTSHPLNVRAQEAAARIAQESNGRMEVRVFPNNQLGGDTDMLAQVRSGGIDMFNAGTMVIATLAPISAMGISLFKSLSAALTSLLFSEVYSALQTKVVDAQENPLAIVQTAKLYEVQKYCSLTNHSWDGYHLVVNGRAWRGLPDDL